MYNSRVLESEHRVPVAGGSIDSTGIHTAGGYSCADGRYLIKNHGAHRRRPVTGNRLCAVQDCETSHVRKHRLSAVWLHTVES